MHAEKTNKIETYKLGETILKLTAEGKRTYQIPESLNAILAEKGILNSKGKPETISQPTISRWLKNFRKDSGEEYKVKYIQNNEKKISKMLDGCFEVFEKYMSVFKGKKEKNMVGGQMNFFGPNLKERLNAGKQAVLIAEKNFKFIGITEEQEPEGNTQNDINPRKRAMLKKVTNYIANNIEDDEPE